MTNWVTGDYTPSQPLTVRRGMMTVCVAALANDAKAIVLVSDKAITYGDNRVRPAVQGDSGGVEKLLAIGGSGWHALMAGSSTIAEDITRQMADGIATDPSVPKSYAKMMECAKLAYQHVRETSIVDQVLQPLLLTKNDVVARANTLLPLPDSLVLDVVSKLQRFSSGTSLLICGFDDQNVARIFTVTDPGQIINHDVEGFGVIGIGAETARARLLWDEAEEEDDLDLALYQAFEAKAYTEMIQGIGERSDVWIMIPGSIEDVPERVLTLLHSVFDYHSQMPFKARPRWKPAPPPAKNWETSLKKYTRGILKRSTS